MEKMPTSAASRKLPNDGRASSASIFTPLSRRRLNTVQRAAAEKEAERKEALARDAAGADADRFLDRRDEDLAVADAAGLGRLADRLDGALDQSVGQDDLQLHLGQEVDHVLGAAVELGMPLLTAEALDLGYGDALNADFRQ